MYVQCTQVYSAGNLVFLPQINFPVNYITTGSQADLGVQGGIIIKK